MLETIDFAGVDGPNAYYSKHAYDFSSTARLKAVKTEYKWMYSDRNSTKDYTVSSK